MKLYVITGNHPREEGDVARLIAADDQLEAECKFVHVLGDEVYDNPNERVRQDDIACAVRDYGVSIRLGTVTLIGELLETTAVLDASTIKDIL